MSLDPAAALDRVCADHADRHRVRATLAWLLTPRQGRDGLRRAVETAGGLLTPSDEPVARLDAVLAERVVAPPVAALVDAAVASWADLDTRAATAADDGYPHRLARWWPHRDVPPLVAWRGAPQPTGPAVAVVGSRAATGYGRAIAAWLAAAAGNAGVRVVSGGARGIDAAAHEAAVETPGGTTVVLGCGHAVAYPRDHARPGGLFDRVRDHGGTLLSELPPAARPHPGAVRARNRVVAALVDAVVVVEGNDRSGALLTAGAAADLGVPVLAVPGDVRAPGSAAPHRLLAEGAAPCTSPADLLESLAVDDPTAMAGTPGSRALGGGPPGGTERGGAGPPSVLPATLRRLLVEAWPRALAVDELAERTGTAPGALLGALTRARVAGEVAEDATGVRLRRAPRA